MDSELDSSTDELAEIPVEEFQSVGDRLRSAREAKGLELAHIAAETRIPLRHLETIERGAFEDLPSRTYAIGFARSYARLIDLDEREIAAAVREELSDGTERRSALAGGMEPGDPAKMPSQGLAWFGAIAAVILVIGVIAFYNTYFASGIGPASLLAEGEQAQQSDAERAAAGSESAAPAANGQTITGNGTVVFTALEDNIWVRFYEDGGERLFEAHMVTGDTFEVPGDASVPLINTARPDALAITIDGRSVPKLANEPIILGDAPISAKALLARADKTDIDPVELN